MATETGCTFQQGNGRWIARYTVDGKRKQVYGLTEEEANKKRQEKIDEINKTSLVKIETEDKMEPNKHNSIEASNKDDIDNIPRDNGTTLGEWLTEWLEIYVKPHKSISTYRGYKIFVNKHIIPAIGNISLKDLTPDAVRVFFNAKISDEKPGFKDEGMSPQSMRNLHFMMKSALNSALDEKLISYNYMDCVNVTKVTRKDKRILNPEEEKNLIEVCRASDKIIMHGVTIALRLGLNIGELLALRWVDLDPIEKHVFVRNTLRRGEDESASSKKKTALLLMETNATRIIHDYEISDCPFPLYGTTHPSSQVGFFAEMELFQEKYNARIGVVPDTVIAGSNGSPVDPGYYLRLFKKMLDLAGIANANFDILRNTFAVRLFEKGYDIADVHRIMGLSISSRPIKTLKHISSG